MRLVRINYTLNGTFGVMLDGEYPMCLTLENPWKDNEPAVSCIPTGEYEVMPVNSPKFGATWEVVDVAGRTHILFHKGNTHLDTHGCILLGERFGHLSGIPAILNSNGAFQYCMTKWSGYHMFPLSIVDATLPF